jgi:hypothetical protein
MIYTTGRTTLTREQLSQIPISDRGGRSDRWAGVNHGDLANTIIRQIDAAGLVATRETWYCNDSESALWGAVDIEIPSCKMDIGHDASFSLGVRHGNKGEFAIQFAVGGRIAVCSNGLFTGDFTLSRRHTNNVDLDDAVSKGIIRYINEAGSLEHFVHSLQGVNIDDRDAAHIILESSEGVGTGSCINFVHLKDIYELWKNPPHEEFSPRTGWSLYNAFTEKAKSLTPARQMKLLQGMKPLFIRELKLQD